MVMGKVKKVKLTPRELLKMINDSVDFLMDRVRHGTTDVAVLSSILSSITVVMDSIVTLLTVLMDKIERLEEETKCLKGC